MGLVPDCEFLLPLPFLVLYDEEAGSRENDESQQDKAGDGGDALPPGGRDADVQTDRGLAPDTVVVGRLEPEHIVAVRQVRPQGSPPSGRGCPFVLVAVKDIRESVVFSGQIIGYGEGDGKRVPVIFQPDAVPVEGYFFGGVFAAERERGYYRRGGVGIVREPVRGKIRYSLYASEQDVTASASQGRVGVELAVWKPVLDRVVPERD